MLQESIPVGGTPHACKLYMLQSSPPDVTRRGDPVSNFRGRGDGWGRMAVRLGLRSLHNEVQCIMGNGGNGDMRISAVDRMTYRQIDTTEISP